MEKLMDKGKLTIQLETHPHTKLVGKLNDKSSKIIYIPNKQLKDTQKN